MRTTIVIDDSLNSRLKTLASKKSLSEFINQCVREHFEREERIKKFKELEKAYLRASKETSLTDDFKTLDHKDWPEW